MSIGAVSIGGDPLWVAVGSGSVNTLAYSTDGEYWVGEGNTIFSNGDGNRVAYGNGLWVAVGSGGNTLATSTDGKTWGGLGISVFTTAGYGVAYSNNIWVAVGSGGNSLAYSNDGKTWVGLGFSVFNNFGYGVAYGNGMWVAGGSGNSTLAYSYDGKTWTGVLPRQILTNAVGAVAYGNGKWLAVGTNAVADSGVSVMAGSDNGITWYEVTGISSIFTSANGVAYGNGVWVAVGSGTYTIATSTDGITWFGRSRIFAANGFGVAYSAAQKLWVATGNGINTFAYSLDNGNTWVGTSGVFTVGQGVAVGTSGTAYFITNYNTNTDTNAYTDIGNLFCDVSNPQVITGRKTFNGTVNFTGTVNVSGTINVPTPVADTNAVNKAYVTNSLSSYAPKASPVFSGTPTAPAVNDSTTNYQIITTNDLKNAQFTGNKLPYYTSSGGDASGSMATQPWVNSVLPISFLTTWRINGQVFATNTNYYISTSGITTTIPTSDPFPYGIYLVTAHGLVQSSNPLTPNLFYTNNDANYMSSSFIVLGNGEQNTGGSWNPLSINRGGYTTNSNTPSNIGISCSNVGSNSQYFTINLSDTGFDRFVFPFYVAVTVCAFTPNISVII